MAISEREPKWDFPSETTLLSDEDYVELEVIDLSAVDLATDPATLGDSQRRILRDTIERTIRAFSMGLGMVHIVGHGLSGQDIMRQFAAGSVFFDGVSEQEKKQRVGRIAEEGNWAGYKPQGYYGPHDCDESFNFYPDTIVESRMPHAVRHFANEYRSFLEHIHYVIVSKMLYILSIGLGLPSDTLWRLHHRGGYESDRAALRTQREEPMEWKHSQDHLKFQMYNPRKDDEASDKSTRLYVRSHCDFGSMTLNYSQPIAALQVPTHEGKWAWVRQQPGAIVVNLGHAMEFLTAGRLKAVFHRVAEPPADQRRSRRLCIHCFVKFLPDVCIDKPLFAGRDDQFEEYRRLGGKPLTYRDWEVFRSKWAYKPRPSDAARPGPRTPEDVLLDIHFREGPPLRMPNAKL